MLLRFGSQEPSSSFFQSRRNTSYAGHSPADYDGTRRVAVTTYYVVDTQEVPRVRLHREETPTAGTVWLGRSGGVRDSTYYVVPSDMLLIASLLLKYRYLLCLASSC